LRICSVVSAVTLVTYSVYLIAFIVKTLQGVSDGSG